MREVCLDGEGKSVDPTESVCECVCLEVREHIIFTCLDIILMRYVNN